MDATRSITIRKRSKRGEYISPDDSKWNAKIYEKYPEWYKTSEAVVFNETVPFGSNVKYK